jgi:hypothetical protein
MSYPSRFDVVYALTPVVDPDTMLASLAARQILHRLDITGEIQQSCLFRVDRVVTCCDLELEECAPAAL